MAGRLQAKIIDIDARCVVKLNYPEETTLSLFHFLIFNQSLPSHLHPFNLLKSQKTPMSNLSSSDIQQFIDSGLFDQQWYSNQYPDVALSGLEPLEHFIKVGHILGRRFPNAYETQKSSSQSDLEKSDLLIKKEIYDFIQEYKKNGELNKYSIAKQAMKKLFTRSLLNDNKKIKKPIAIISTYNDCDIIEDIILEALKQFDVYILDNWSTDGTWETIQRINNCGMIGKEQFPHSGPCDDYEWRKILIRKEEIASKFSGRWILHQDSDEITLMPFQNIDARNIFESVLDMGYNVIPLRMIDFRPVDDNFTHGNPCEYFKYYEYSEITSYLMQNKIWYQENNSQVDLSSNGGHEVSFNGAKVFPLRFPRLHFSVRSTAQKAKKSKNRLLRSKKERESIGWHAHLDSTLLSECLKSADDLIEYKFNDLYNSYFSKFIYE